MKRLLFVLTAVAVMVGCIITGPRPARADDNTAEIVIGTVAAAGLIWYLTADDDDPGQGIEQVAGVLAPLIVNEAEGWLNSPACAEALGTEGAGLAQAAATFLLPRVLNRAGDLANGAQPAVLAYEWLQRERPDLAAMIWREQDGVPRGLAPRLDAWLTDHGYTASAELYARLNRGDLDLRLTSADRDELINRAARAIVEEYYAVQAVTMPITSGESDDLPLTIGSGDI